MFKNCLFHQFPSIAQDLSAMYLAPSVWIGDPLTVGPQNKLVISTGDLIAIAGVDRDGGIYIKLEDGSFVGAVEPNNLVPWRTG